MEKKPLVNKTDMELVLKAAMSILGSRTSAAKKRSSRLNGAKRKRRQKISRNKSGQAIR